MAANNTETITQKRTRPKKIILDISASFSLSGISTSKLEKSEGLKFGFNSTWAIRRVNKRKTSPSTKSKIGTSAIVAAIASAPTTTEEPKNIAIPATSTAIVAIPASIDRESDVKLDEVIGLLDSNMPGTPSARNRSSLIANANANANTMIASPILAQVQRVQSIRSASTRESSSPPPSQSPKSKPSQSQPKPARTAPKPTKSELPLKALNQSITSRLTTPSGARSTGRGKPLPGNYQNVARRVTMTIVALPILFVTSWVLWDRLVLGQEKKSLLRDPPMVPGPPMAAEMEARNNRK